MFIALARFKIIKLKQGRPSPRSIRNRLRILITFCFCLASVAICFSQVLEAENGALVGTQVSTQRDGYSGAGYVTGFDANGDKVTMTATITLKGIYNLYIRYAAPAGEKFNFVYVNDQNLGSVQFAASTVFKETQVGKIYLNKGINYIAIVKDWGYFELDNIRLEASEASDITPIATNLVTPNPSPETLQLHSFLSKTYGKAILSGQYGGDIELNRIQVIAGKTPLVRGFDLIEYSPSRVERGATSTETEKVIAWNEQRGIATLSWHWNAPKDLIDQPGKEWWRGFYTDATTFDVTKAMNDATSEEHILIIRDIDAIAVQLKKLQDANVPVLWRPLHEAEGAWFWWGAKGPEACKWLWKLVFERLVTHHQLNNLIWVWTSAGTSSAPEWYPGDEYADIIGADIYLPEGTYSSNFIAFDNLVALYEGKKIITLSENGPIPDPGQLFQEGAAWSWFCTWSGDFIMDGFYNSIPHVNMVYNHEYVITLDELDNIDNILAALEAEKAQADDNVVLGMDELELPDVSYQNPIRNNRLILIWRTTPDIAHVAIYNVHGEVEFKRENIDPNTNQWEFDFSDKSPGLYLIRATIGGSNKVVRVIKI